MDAKAARQVLEAVGVHSGTDNWEHLEGLPAGTVGKLTASTSNEDEAAWALGDKLKKALATAARLKNEEMAGEPALKEIPLYSIEGKEAPGDNGWRT